MARNWDLDNSAVPTNLLRPAESIYCLTKFLDFDSLVFLSNTPKSTSWISSMLEYTTVLFGDGPPWSCIQKDAACT